MAGSDKTNNEGMRLGTGDGLELGEQGRDKQRNTWSTGPGSEHKHMIQGAKHSLKLVRDKSC